VQLELIYETSDTRSCLKSVLADTDYIHCLGNFFSVNWLCTANLENYSVRGVTSWLSPIGGNLELECFEQLIALYLEFESAFWGQTTCLACN
jgi:hypothetical protein